MEHFFNSILSAWLLVIAGLGGWAFAQEETRNSREAASQMLEIGEVSVQELDEELTRLKNLNPPPDAEIAEKTAYRARLGALVERQRRLLADFEDVAQQPEVLERDEVDQPDLDSGLPPFEEEAFDQGREFDDSKREFDQKMMDEMARIGVIEDGGISEVGNQDSSLAEAMEAARRRLEQQDDEHGAEQGRGGRSGRGGEAGEPSEEQGKQGTGQHGEGGAEGDRDGSEGDGDLQDGDMENEDDGKKIVHRDEEGIASGDAPDRETEKNGTGSEAERGEFGRQGEQRGGAGGANHGDEDTDDLEMGNGSDDDIVARQLREAAEKETDPTLKKKLWEEYKKYKQST